MEKKTKDLRCGIFLVIFSLIVYFLVIPMQIKTRKGITIGADFFPKLLVIVIGICGLALIFQSLYDLKKTHVFSLKIITNIDIKTVLKKYMPQVILLLSTFAYLIIMQFLGFVLSSIPFLIFLLLLFGHSKMGWCTITSIIYVTTVYIVFSNIFRIKFPIGPFGF